MRSSTSSSDAAPRGASGRSYAARALCVIGVVLAVPLAAGHLIGRRYHPQPLAPTAEEVRASGQFIALFGNSRIEAGVEPAELARLLEGAPAARRPTVVRSFTGGGWDAIHYLQLALLQADVLRPGDAVVIETSPLSVDDSDSHNRLGVIRPTAALATAALPGAPWETRFDVLVGALCGLYRYRTQVQGQLLWPQVERRSAHLADRLEGSLVGAPARTPPFEVISDDNGYFIKEVRGDLGALAAASRRHYDEVLRGLSVGGWKEAAFERAVERLRARGVAVYLVEVPLGRWLTDRLATRPDVARLRDRWRALASRTGATLLDRWPDALRDEASFWDGMHMRPAARDRFTVALAAAIGAPATASLPADAPPRRTP